MKRTTTNSTRKFGLKGACLAGAALLSASLISTSAEAATDPQSCQSIRFAEIGWSDIHATTGVASALASALGYQPSTKLVSIPIAFTGLGRHDLDVFLGYWSPSADQIIKPFVQRGQVKVLKPANLTGAKYTLAVPAYEYNAGLKTFGDIAKFKQKLGGRIYGIEPGNDGNKLIQGMISDNKFNLGDFHLIASSEAGMLTQVSRATRSHQWIVFLGWAPHPMNQEFDMRYLNGGDSVFGPDQGAAKVYSVTSPDYAQRCPNANRLISNLSFNVNMEGQLMKANNKEDTSNTSNAIAWIKQHPQHLSTWLKGVTTFNGGNAAQAIKKAWGVSYTD